MKEQLVHTAIETFNKLNIFECSIMEQQSSEVNANSEMQIRISDCVRTYNIEVIPQILPIQIAKIQEQLKKFPPCILIAEYITTQAKKILQEHKVAYLDTAGNIYINDNGLFIYIETNKTNRTKSIVSNRAFGKAGLKVLYQFLINPEYLNKPYREIGKQAQVTIHTVGKVISELLLDKYIVKENKKQYRFTDRKKLFQDWVIAFNKVLRPKLKQKKYRLLKKESDFKNIKLPNNSLWGGAVGAETITNYLIADKAIIYTSLPFLELVKKMKLIPDSKGNIQLIETFWESQEEKNSVHSMLIYADLINDFDPRYLETATKIYSQNVENKL